ncbi:MAG: DUF309 domain-containing protein [Pseudomonadota bacterium]
MNVAGDLVLTWDGDLVITVGQRKDVATRLEAGRVAFNDGDFFRAHELWEDAWRKLDGTPRLLAQGLIQVAAGLHHVQSDRFPPGARLLVKGLDKLDRGAAAVPDGLRVDLLARAVSVLLTRLPP